MTSLTHVNTKRPLRPGLAPPESENMKVFKSSASKPYYLLSSKELDVVIYYHSKYLRMMRQEKLNAEKQTADSKGKPVFFTNVDVEQTNPEKDKDNGETAKDSHDQRETRSMQSLGRPRLAGLSQRITNDKSPGTLSRKLKYPPWMKSKKGPKFVLDFRRHKSEVDADDPGDTPEPIEKLRMMYYNQAMPNRATYFIPKLKGPRNPQLAKIQAYFVAVALPV